MTTLSKEDVVRLIEELGAGSNWLSGKHNVYSYNRQPKIAAMFLKAFAEQGLLELIAELRKPHDWKIEGFGHFKDAKTYSSDAPFRAADVLEHFATLARADLVAENERLKATPPDQRQDLHCVVSDISAECRELRTALAAAEAREEKLLDALDNHSGNYKLSKDECATVNALIDAPRDDSALREMITKSIKEFVYKFKRNVGGDGEFWLHELEDFLAGYQE